MDAAVEIDPKTGERVQKQSVAIDPATGERIATASQQETSRPQHSAAVQTAIDLAKGVGKGALSTVSVADDWARQHLPAFMTNSNFGFGPPADLARLHEATQTHNTAQAIGKGAEQIGEFFIPGTGLEEGAANVAAKVAPKLTTAARIAGAATTAGAVNKMQGGSFSGGAAAGAAGAALAAGIKAAAPTIAEIAMGARATDRAYGRTPGEAILAETTGVKPGEVAKQAFDKVAGYTKAVEDAARNSNVPVDLVPANSEAASFLSTAAKQNNRTTIKEVQELADQLTRETGSGASIPTTVTADRALALRRGVDDLMNSWNPNNKRGLSDAAVSAVRGAINDELSKAVPNYSELNAKISSLIPAAQRIGAKDLSAGVLERVLGKFARPTGALVGTVAGGTAGYKEGGTQGAILGGLAGAVAPEVVTSPAFLMGAARAANSALPSQAARFATGAALQAVRPTDRWANVGAANLARNSALTPDEIDALRGIPKGDSILWRAGSLKPGSKAMDSLVKEAREILSQ